MDLSKRPVARDNFLNQGKQGRSRKLGTKHSTTMVEAAVASSEGSSGGKPILNKDNFPSSFDAVRRAALLARPQRAPPAEAVSVTQQAALH